MRNIGLKSVAEITQVRQKLEGAVSDLWTARSSVSDKAIQHNIDLFQFTAEYAMRDMDIQKSRAARVPNADILRQLRDLVDWLDKHKTQDGNGTYWSLWGFDGIRTIMGIPAQ